MGLTNRSTGLCTPNSAPPASSTQHEHFIVFAGNPNVGKSTLFNALTGLHQHTGNWAGKTVANAQGRCRTPHEQLMLADIPGTYSLLAHSAEEEVARNLICFGHPDAVVVVCDATCLERNLNLVLQILETGARVLVCVNLMDEAKRRHITLDLPALSALLGVPVISTVARSRRAVETLRAQLETLIHSPPISTEHAIRYPIAIERAVDALIPRLKGTQLNPRWLAVRLLEGDAALLHEIDAVLGSDWRRDATLLACLTAERARLEAVGLHTQALRDTLVTTIMQQAHALCQRIMQRTDDSRLSRDRRVDRLLTGRRVGYPTMLLLLALIFWITIEGANIPSTWLANGLFWLQEQLSALFAACHAPPWLHDLLVLGVYRTLAWVVSVMLPPMAIFFPLFTLLEDVGYLPRIAYNLDRPFQRCRACGKQALTMCMGFGCNAAGVVGCRIIDSPRERLLAVLTNSFVPCNGRFPTLLALLCVFFVGIGGSSLAAAGLLTGVILLGVLATFAVTRLLSATVLRGMPSSFTLELPPYRRPQIGRVILRSMLDRTLFVLGRAVAVAAPAGLVLWCMANLTVGDATLLARAAELLDPLGWLMGLDGVILIAFILGFPANELVLPIILMAYQAGGTLTDAGDLTNLHTVLTANGWTTLTAVCTVLFMLFHWPCSTTLLTIHKETDSKKWTLLAALLPTAVGVLLCILTATLARLFSII